MTRRRDVISTYSYSPTRLRGAPKSHAIAHYVAARSIRGSHLAWRAALSLSPYPTSARLLIDRKGGGIHVDPFDGGQRRLYRGFFEGPEREIVRRLLRPGDRCIDVGANVGLYSVLFASLVGPTGHVLAVEPSPPALVHLREALAAYPQCEVLAIAASDTTGQAAFTIDESHLGASNLRGGEGSLSIATTTIDEISGQAPIAMLKLDVEGHEQQALNGASATLTRTSYAFIEVSPEFGDIRYLDLLSDAFDRYVITRAPSRSPIRPIRLTRLASSDLITKQANVLLVNRGMPGPAKRLNRFMP